MQIFHYTTSDGFRVRFGTHGWVIIDKNPSYSRERTEEIWKEWIVYWKSQ